MKKGTSVAAGRCVLMIGWDAADAALVDRMCLDGQLPALQRLRKQGASGTLDSERLVFAGGVWPSFYTSKEVPWHGVYQNRLWRADRMAFEVAGDSWLPIRAFWESLPPERRVAAIDVPMTISKPKQVNGVQLAGWATHDLVARGSSPRELWSDLRRRFGGPVVEPELFGPQSPSELARLRRALAAGTKQITEISEWLLRRDSWDLFLVVFGAPHRAGHYLWDRSQVAASANGEEESPTLECALEDVYADCDRALGRLLAEVSDDTLVLVFAVHGMGPNPGWSDRLPDLLTRLDDPAERVIFRPGVSQRLKELLPPVARRLASRFSPHAWRDRVLGPWTAHAQDWSETRFFGLDMDHSGYIRINLRGRECRGIVSPGAEYAALQGELTTALLGLRDVDSGEAIVDRVVRVDELACEDAPYRDLLPDLVVTWGTVPAAGCRGVRDDDGRETLWEEPLVLPSGRSGNHHGRGWFVATGDGIPAGLRIEGASRIDLAPTVTHWLGAACPDAQGRPIPELVFSEIR